MTSRRGFLGAIAAAPLLAARRPAPVAEDPLWLTLAFRHFAGRDRDSKWAEDLFRCRMLLVEEWHRHEGLLGRVLIPAPLPLAPWPFDSRIDRVGRFVFRRCDAVDFSGGCMATRLDIANQEAHSKGAALVWMPPGV